MGSHTVYQFARHKSSQFLFYNHVQVLMSIVHKLTRKQKWSVESFSTFVRLKDGLPHQNMCLYRVSHKKGIDKKLKFGAAQCLNLQFLNLFGFRISVNFVWCIT